MRLIQFLIALAVVLVLCATPSKAAAQVTGTWDCGSSTQCGTVMGTMTGYRTFNSMDDCNAWGQRYIPGGYSCTGAGESGGTRRMQVSNVSAATAIVQAALFGGLLGGTAGSFAKHENGESMALEGALAGASAWGLISMAANKSNRSEIGSVVVGTATGCAGGNAAGLYLDNNAKGASTAELDPSKKQLTKATEAGCAAGFVVGAALPALMNKLPPLRWMTRTGHKPSFINSGGNAGLLILW